MTGSNVDVLFDPLAAVTAEINKVYARAVAAGDENLKAVALRLLTDVATRRKQLSLRPNPIELAHTTGSA